jgi:hypothetical protein
MRTRVFVVSLALALGLTACTTGAPTDPTPTPTPVVSTIAIPPGAIPADCQNVVDSATYEATFGPTPLNDPGLGYTEGLGMLSPTAPAVDAPIAEAVDAGTQLRCIWRYPEADITYLQLQIGSVAAGLGEKYLDSLELDGYTCDETLDGSRCALTGTDPQYQTDTADTAFVRNDIVIRIDQANFPTDNLLGAVVSTVWPE